MTFRNPRFVDDEAKHHRPQLPIPKALLEQIRAKYADLASKPIAKVRGRVVSRGRRRLRPSPSTPTPQPPSTRTLIDDSPPCSTDSPTAIHQVAEARARKKRHAALKLKAAKKKAEALANEDDMSEKQKLKAIEKAMKAGSKKVSHTSLPANRHDYRSVVRAEHDISVALDTTRSFAQCPLTCQSVMRVSDLHTAQPAGGAAGKDLRGGQGRRQGQEAPWRG